MVVCFGSPAIAEDEEPTGDLPSLHQIGPGFYRGGQPTESGFALLAKAGVKTILNLRADDEKSQAEEQWAKKAGLRYFNIPMEGKSRPTDEQVRTALTIINAPENQPVFLHCKRGKDRTGTIVACYRISQSHWKSDDAIKEARRLGMSWSEFGMRAYIRNFERSQTNKLVAVEASKTALKEQPEPKAVRKQ